IVAERLDNERLVVAADDRLVIERPTEAYARNVVGRHADDNSLVLAFCRHLNTPNERINSSRVLGGGGNEENPEHGHLVGVSELRDPKSVGYWRVLRAKIT